MSKHRVTDTICLSPPGMTPDEITSTARKGAAWSLVIAGIAFPLPYVRDILLGRIDEAILGQFAVLLLLLNALPAFFLIGGRNVAPTFLPKLQDEGQRARFMSGYLFLALCGAAAALLVTTVWPGLLDVLVAPKTLDPTVGVIVRCLIPIVLLSILTTSFVMSRMSFVWASVLTRSQLLCSTAIAAVMYFGEVDGMAADALAWLAGAMAFGALLTLLISWFILFRSARPTWRVHFPPGYFRFCLVSNLDAWMVFGYLAIDQYIVLHRFGFARLGIYFALLRIARLIPLAVQQLGHLLLTTFSNLLATGGDAALGSAYRRVSRLTVGFYAFMALAIVFFSRVLASLFGPVFAEDHAYLICLAVVINIDSLRTVNAMTLMAHERMPAVFTSKLTQNVVQLVLTILLISPMGIYGVILAKGAGHIVGAATLIAATARLRKAQPLLPPAAFPVGQAVVLAGGCTAYLFDGRSLGWSAIGLLIGWAILWFAGGFTADDLRAMWPRRRPKGGESL